MLVDKDDGSLKLPNLSNNQPPKKRNIDADSRIEDASYFSANRKYSLGNADDMNNYDKGFIGVGKAMLDHQASKVGKDPYGGMASDKSNRSKTLQSPGRSNKYAVSAEK